MPTLVYVKAQSVTKLWLHSQSAKLSKRFSSSQSESELESSTHKTQITLCILTIFLILPTYFFTVLYRNSLHVLQMQHDPMRMQSRKKFASVKIKIEKRWLAVRESSAIRTSALFAVHLSIRYPIPDCLQSMGPAHWILKLNSQKTSAGDATTVKSKSGKSSADYPMFRIW